ncbi:uncharacterized protein LOC143344666 [Colletes latitarsis]|uniref:uncharacterized protein LOC143344666 n=1 Tax=Colletes latitarsis TaxID=2605962 RepID=UPI0040367091
MPKLTNRYYSQYESSAESEFLYDSDNSDSYNRLMNSPSQVSFRRYIEHRNDEEEMHEFWKDTLHEKKNHAKEIKKQCGMAVDLTDNRVSYIYEPVINESSIEGIKFVVTLKYIKLLRKWYLSLGYSRLPEVIKLDNNIKNGVYNPIERRVLNMMREIKILLDNFVQRLTYVHQVIDKVKETYRDIQFDIDKSLVYLKVLLVEKGWPKNLEKTSSKDIIILKLKLDENLQTKDISYEYICEKSIPKEIKEMCTDKLENMVKIFFSCRLMEAFEKFMNEEISVENEHFEEVSPSS